MKSLLLLPFSLLLATSDVAPGRAQLLPRPSVPSTVAPLSFDDIFADLNAPLSYKIKDLKGEWRLVTIKSRPDLDNGSIAPISAKEALTSDRLRAAIGAGEGQYVTQGQTVAAGGELFLVTYKMKYDENELQGALEAGARQATRTLPLPPAELAAAIENYTHGRPLELRLLNVKMLGEISEIRAFDAASQSKALRDFITSLTAEVNGTSDHGEGIESPLPTSPVAPTLGNGNLSGNGAGNTSTPIAPTPPTGMLAPTSKPPVTKPATNSTVVKPLPPATLKPAAVPGLQERNAASQKNLHLIGLALIAYAQDHNGTLPPAQTPGIARKVLTFYAGSDKIWARADNGQAYLPNPKMSGRKASHISNPDEWVAFYEANPASDGTRGVVFLDGSVARITLGDWPRYKKASKLP
jgi:hypothetical protein